MSLELDIIPEESGVVTIQGLREEFRKESIAKAVATLNFKPIGNSDWMKSNDVFLVGEHYQVDGIGGSTITVVFEETEDDDDDFELDMLEDFGRNLSSEEIKRIAASWRHEAYTLKLSSFAGRAKNELTYLKALTNSFARALKGKVMLKQSGIMTLSIGVYSPEEFQEANFII